MASLCHRPSSGCVSTINAGFARRSRSSSDSVKTAFRAEEDASGGELIMDSGRLLATLDKDPGFEDTEATELTDALPLVEVDDDDVPPKPKKPSVAGLDSSGNRSPVRVSFESHMRVHRTPLAHYLLLLLLLREPAAMYRQQRP